VQLRELLRDLEVLDWLGDPEVEVTSLTHDSRRIEPGACFACLGGVRTDGHAHAPEAVESGASSLLVDRLLPLDVTQARVADVRAVLGGVAARLHGEPSRSLRVVGVTGTNGKTTTVSLIDAIGRAAGERVGVIGTLGTRIEERTSDHELTTPESTDLQATLATMHADGIGLVAMEVSSHALVRHRIDGTHFAAACFTNLSHDHLDEHRTMAEYFAAKELLFEPGRTAIGTTNLDDPFGRRLAERLAETDVDCVTYAVRDERARIGAQGVSYQADGTRFDLLDRESGAHASIENELLGEFNVANQLAAAASASALGLPFDAVITGLGTATPIPGRLERVEAGQSFSVLVDYAHTPDSLDRALEVSRLLGGRVAVVFGCGGDRDPTKRPMMGAVAGRRADLVIVTSDNPRDEDPGAIAAAVVSGLPDGVDAVVELDRRRAIEHALVAAQPGDVVLVAGKGHETGQTVAGVTRSFDDRLVVRELLGARRCA